MADSLNTTNLSRRSILGTGIAAAGALAALSPLPLKAAQADTEIIRLYAAYVEAEQRDAAASAAWDEARSKAVTAAKTKLGIVHKKGTEPPPRFRAMPIEEWEAAIDKQVEALGFAPLQAATEAAEAARYEAWQALADTPAKSVTMPAFIAPQVPVLSADINHASNRVPVNAGMVEESRSRDDLTSSGPTAIIRCSITRKNL
jgi:hypothetical protein